MSLRAKIPIGALAVLAGCGGGMQRMVATAPLPVVESCSARVAESLGWRLVVLSRTTEAVELRPSASGKVYDQATSPSSTTSYKRPLTDGRRVVGIVVVNTDPSGEPIRTAGKSLSRLVLKPTGARETTPETKSYDMTPYREIAEQCAAVQDSTRSGS